MTRLTEADLKATLQKRGYRVRTTQERAAGSAGRPQRVTGGHTARSPLDKATDAYALAIKQDVDRRMRAGFGEIEAMFELQLLEAPLIIVPAFQHKPIATRKFRVDVAFVSGSVMLNVPGIIFEVQGHVHRIKAQFLRDMERHNLLTEAGWVIYYVSGDMVRDGRGLNLAKRIIGTRGV